MKNIKYFSFERNKYYYGKLLSVGDFETEQRYMNDKRRLINRFVNGCGVVCGLNVFAVDDATISIERGLALDFAGREIVVDTPVTKKLSMIEGFEDYSDIDGDKDDLYLCIRYDEKKKEAVHSISGMQRAEGDEVEYNKYEEGYTLFLTNKEPEGSIAIADNYYKDTKIIYRGNGFTVKQEIPRYVKSNGECEIKITVEKRGQNKPINFSYEISANCLQDYSGNAIKIEFDEEKFEKNQVYQIVKKVRTIPVVDVNDRVSITPDSFILFIGKKKVVTEVEYETVVNVTEKDIKQQIINNYYDSIMNDVMQNSYEQYIYLARLSIVKAGLTYIINTLEPMPYNQYIFNTPLNTVMEHMNRDYPKINAAEKVISNNVYGNAYGKDLQGQLVSSGEVIIDLGIGGNAGQRFYSKEISHGLGLGNVSISLGVAYSVKENNAIVYGAQDIFADKDSKVKASLAAKLDPESGKFVIGLKCLETTDERQVKVHWIAVKDKQDIIVEKIKETMHIKPDMLNIETKQTQYYEAIIGGENESRVKWSVKEKNGGTIDENGMYTAPNRQGVFEIIAESMDNPGVKASTFVVVREKNRS